MVYSYEEFANFLKNNHRQADFGFVNSVKTFWKYSNLSTKQNTSKGYNFEYNFMIYTIGISFTVEYGIKYLYENTIGRLTAWTANEKTEEDIFIEKSWHNFSEFVYIEPWYKYDYLKDVKNIWTENSFFKKDFIRSFERKISFTISYFIKFIYAKVIGFGSSSAFGAEENKTLSVVSNFDIENLSDEAKSKIKVLKILYADRDVYLIETPRYQEFTEISKYLLSKNVQFLEIMNNSSIAVSYVSTTESEPFNYLNNIQIISKEKLSGLENKNRIILNVDVQSLGKVYKELQKQNIEIEHIYDY
jgi:hypothetical protein